MSVAAAIKNVILVMLIILILHFLIKNITLERKANNRFASLMNDGGDSDSERGEQEEEAQCIPYIAIKARTCPPSNPPSRRNDGDDDHEVVAICGEKPIDLKDELQRFVFEDHGELEKFFVPVDDDKRFENEFKIQCDANVEEKRKMEQALQRTKDDDSKKDPRVDALSFLNEYHPDKAPLGDELMAYDTYGSLFGSACGNASTPWESAPPECPNMKK